MPRVRAQVPEVSGYVERLNATWLDHLAPRAIDAPTVISTFAGCGGSSLGYSMAGFRELLAVEWDQNAVDTFRLNFPEVPVHHGDIAALSVDECLSLTGLQPGELDVFDGSPPCQGFSTAGKRNMDDSRNQLFREYVRLLRGLRPKVFVMENVSGMVKGKMKLVFAEILRELKASGYQVSARLMNAMYFDVPQSRERMIFIGVRDDLAVTPSHPRARSKPISAKDAVERVDFDTEEVAMLIDAGRRYQTYRFWDQLAPGQSNERLLGTSGFSAVKLDPTKPCPTVQRTDSVASAHGAMHWSERRRFTTREYMRFASFPDSFCFSGDWSNAVERIGNSVPPLFMRAIAEHIRTNLLTAQPVHAMAAD